MYEENKSLYFLIKLAEKQGLSELKLISILILLLHTNLVKIKRIIIFIFDL